MEEKKLSDIAVYTIKLFDKTISPDEFEELNSIISSSSQAARIYNQFVAMISNFEDYAEEIITDESTSEGVLNKDFWRDLSEHERKAPSIELPQEKPQRELSQKITYPPREKRKVSKFQIIFLAINTAAVLFVVLFLKLTPPSGGVEVATLTDSINATWADASRPMQSGTRLYNDKTPFMLKKGLVELTFDNNAQVTIEGPAEFQIADDDMIKLSYGQLYAHVPTEAYGFQVSTQNSKIIDLGTEFGVKAGFDGDTEVHVVKGKVNFISSVLGKKIHIDLLAGSAQELDAETGELKEISCEDKSFARQIDSKTNIVWRGQQTLDLADMVGGGNGLGTGQSDIGLDPGTAMFNQKSRYDRKADNAYHRVESSSFIDGVFIPDGTTKQVVSSLGHTFSECPPTQGWYYTEIQDRYLQTGEYKAVLGGINYTQRNLPYLVMHANVGITYDLQAIRSKFKNVKITRFQSTVGIDDGALGSCNAGFWVLVDGVVRYKKENVKTGFLDSIEINLSNNDRFLTLITTDGGDPDERVLEDRIAKSTDMDWCMFGEPVLELALE